MHIYSAADAGVTLPAANNNNITASNGSVSWTQMKPCLLKATPGPRVDYKPAAGPES